VVAEIFEKHCGLMHSEERQLTLRITVSYSRRGRPFHAFIGVWSVRNHKKGFKCDQRLPRILLNTVLILASSHAVAQHSLFHFSEQPLTAFGSRFNFPDRLNTFDHLQRPKTVRRATAISEAASMSLVISILLAISNQLGFQLSQQQWIFLRSVS
jgi:hypothetical protein